VREKLTFSVLLLLSCSFFCFVFSYQRRFAWLNFPPANDLDLNGNRPDRQASHMYGDLCPDVVVNHRQKKFNTPIHSKTPTFMGAWKIKDKEDEVLMTPEQVSPTVEEMTYMFGYERMDWKENSYGRMTAGPGIMKKWNEHKVDPNKWDGIIVGLNNLDPDATRELTNEERFALLGNSVMPGMMKDLLKSLKELFPVADAVMMDMDDDE